MSKDTYIKIGSIRKPRDNAKYKAGFNSPNNIEVKRDSGVGSFSQKSINSLISPKKMRYNQNPIKSSLSNEKKEIIRRVFEYYTSFGERENTKHLRSNMFIKMMKELGIQVDKVTLDLLFVAENRHLPNMKLEQFLNLLPKLSILNSPGCNDIVQCMEILFLNHFNSKYEEIMKTGFAGSIRDLVTSEVEVEEISELFKVLRVLLQLYRDSFGCEFNKEGDYDNFDLMVKTSKKEYINFCMMYNIFPFYITKGMAIGLWGEIINLDLEWIQSQLVGDAEFQDYGYVFTFSRFLIFLLCINRISIMKRFNETYSPEDQRSTITESLILLLHHLEHSEGFNRMQRGLSSSNSRNGLVPNSSLKTISIRTKSILDTRSSFNNTIKTTRMGSFYSKPLQSTERVVEDNSCSYRGSQSGRKKSFSQSTINKEAKTLRGVPKNKMLLNSIYYEENIILVLEEHLEELNRIFVAYASHGEPMNCTQLKSIKYNKLLRAAKILPSNNNSLTSAPLDLIVSLRKQTIPQERKLSILEADFIFSHLTGARFRDDFNQLNNLQSDSRKNSFLINQPGHLSNKSTLNKGCNGKLEFETFIKSLEMISNKLFPEFEAAEALRELIENRILPLNQTEYIRKGSQGVQHIGMLKELLEDEAVIKILGILHNNIAVYYDCYADSKGMMNFINFLKFFKEFEVFPKLISKAKLSRYFYALASLRESNEEQKWNTSHYSKKYATEQTDAELIDSHLFVESIALISATSIAPDALSLPESVIYGLQRLDSSKGRILVQNRLGVTRAKKGFNWSLLIGLESFSMAIMLAQGYTSPLKRQISFESIYQEDNL